MSYFSALADYDITRKTDFLDHERDERYWYTLKIAPYLSAWFSVLNEETGWLGKVICEAQRIAGEPLWWLFHAEMWVADDAPKAIRYVAESLLGRPYDYYGALMAWDNSGKHTDGREFCSGAGQKIAYPVLTSLQAYPNPARLADQIRGALGLPMPKRLMFPLPITEADLESLKALAIPDASGNRRVATGTVQEVLMMLEIDERG